MKSESDGGKAEGKEESSCTSSMSVCGHWRAREEQGADGAAMEKIKITVCDDAAAADGISPSVKALLSSRKPRSGSNNSLATPLLAAAQIICKWQPRGSELEDAATVAIVVMKKVAAKVMDALVLDLIMVEGGRGSWVNVSNKCYTAGKNFLRDILTLQNQASYISKGIKIK